MTARSSVSTAQPSRRSILLGSVAGVLAWIAGYLVTYLVVAPDVSGSDLNRLIEVLDGEPATAELVGWVFFNAHFVETVFEGLPVLGSRTASYVGGEGGFTVLLYLVPVVTLSVAGLLLARADGATDVSSGALSGLTALPGYALASAVAAVAIEVTAAGASAGPDFLAALILAGIAYPMVFSGLGGALAAVANRLQRSPSTV
ncbi:putative membrane protein [Halapricum desulfuricans]|uniref:Putative membrane protein n=1 Tax=Halapricum desulfuricans TaxID=2841257 RepID=A0A897NJ72_9EURY|nr:hypothetical protein [Halapricum desulfuricans]QSG11003.1 putative membrane protein [Halapricum desulfuricans]